MSFALLLTIACDGEQREIQKKEDDVVHLNAFRKLIPGGVAAVDFVR